jgi:xanthosine utilization system XapX-like protein
LYTLVALLGGLGILIVLGLIRAAYMLLENSTLCVLVFKYLSIEAVIARGVFSI